MDIVNPIMCEEYLMPTLNYKLCLVCLRDNSEAKLEIINGEILTFFVQNLKVNVEILSTCWLCTRCYQPANNAATLARNIERACTLLYQLNQRHASASDTEITEMIHKIKNNQEIISTSTSTSETPINDSTTNTQKLLKTVKEIINRDLNKSNQNILNPNSESNIEYVNMYQYVCSSDDKSDSETNENEDALSIRESDNSVSSIDANDTDFGIGAKVKVCKIKEKASEITNKARNVKTPKSVCRKKLKRDELERIFLNDNKFTTVFLSYEEQMKKLDKKRFSERYIEANLKCKLCGIPFWTKQTYERHMKRHDKSYGPYRCPICSVYFVTTDVMKQHILEHRRIFKCQICEQIVKRRSRLSIHRERCGPNVVPASCHVCGKLCRDNYSLKLHIQSNHEVGKGFECHGCNKSFVVKQKLIIHMRSHTGEKPFECPTCGRCFSTNSNLRTHRLTHTPGKTSHCIECNRYFSTDKGLKRHLMQSVKHVKLEQYKYECKYCPGKFTSPIRLKSHQESHLKKREEVICDICSKVLMGNANLRRHILAVHKVVKQSCEVCGKTFSLKSALIRHMRSHNNTYIYKYTCDKCPGASFIEERTLKAHTTKYHTNTS